MLDDLVVLRPGDQVSVDGEVLTANGLEIDESLLTGEADPVAKAVGDEVLSGAFVAVGNGVMRATRVGNDTHAALLSAEARTFSLVHSELRDGLNRIITWIGWLMPPVAILLITAQIRADLSFAKAVQASVAGLVAMVPEGLVLLTSVAFALGAARLARQHVLTQELAAIEGLARVDVVCLDKTGTLTEGTLALSTVELLGRRCRRRRGGDRSTTPWPHWRTPTSTPTRACSPSATPTPPTRAGPDRDRSVLVGPQVERGRLHRRRRLGAGRARRPAERRRRLQ